LPPRRSLQSVLGELKLTFRVTLIFERLPKAPAARTRRDHLKESFAIDTNSREF
jgi:hypothetical protein